ncbi:probable coatomer subunit zeta [Varroa jacobsoni]|uniref:Coatomer subunit zeta n=1 Tax=Varroa destructor TaxID=109461 RepID=A0A7M7J7M6_VARDE|nr:probable coatomer subunit zeta [Varroa destructor]XP_022710117.1 probable coatomer subunit zeta [Varroa jacobsoni]
MDLGLSEPTLNVIKAIIIMDQDGHRILARYYEPTGPLSNEKSFEKMLFNKMGAAEVCMLEGLTCVHKSNVDLHLYVIGSGNQNPLFFSATLNCLYETLSLLFRKSVEKRALIDQLDAVLLVLDEICDNGVILETDANAVFSRLAVKGSDEEQNVSQLFQSAKEQLKWSLLK